MTTKLLHLVERHPLATFTGLAYLLAWPVWFYDAGSANPTPLLTWISGFAPALAAFILTPLLEGRDGLARLLGRAFHWRFNVRWYLAALGLPLIGTLALIGLYALLDRAPDTLGSVGGWLQGMARHSPVLLLTLALGVVVTAGEEFGWRGFVLPRLRAVRTDLAASLGVGVVWGLWHLPALWPFNPKLDALDLGFFMADILAVSVIYTWLYANSGGSILLVSLFHSAYDTMVMYASATLPFLRAARGYELLVMAIIAALIVMRYRRGRVFSGDERGTIGSGTEKNHETNKGTTKTQSTQRKALNQIREK